MYIKRRIILKAFIQRTLTVGGRITVQLVSSLNRFDLPDSLHTNNNVISSFNNSLTGVQVYSDPSPEGECSLLYLMRSESHSKPEAIGKVDSLGGWSLMQMRRTLSRFCSKRRNEWFRKGKDNTDRSLHNERLCSKIHTIN